MFIEKINSPEDLKTLSQAELVLLAREIRSFITDIISKTGGHLSSNLGVVELTIALHYVFNTPKDKIIWDVGHQCYTHKILTGRRDLFHTIRQDDGLCGFPSRHESPFDVFDTGHASNSISIAVGLAESKRAAGNEDRVIAVIGDGSLTGGMAFEALNHAGHLKSNIIVILNDNEMSISKNIGAMSSYLNRIMTGEFMSSVREKVKSKTKNMPTVYKTARYLEEAIKGFFTPGMLFEELGFQYFGPVEGHDMANLIEMLKNTRRLKGPIIVHVMTKKGRGYSHAETDPERFHGISTFELSTGESIGPDAKTYTDVFGETMIELAEQDDRIVAITAAMGLGTGLDVFSNRFPDRFYDIGIAEQHGVTFAAALALGGLKPFVAIYSTFLQRAFDQIVIDVCLQRLPVVFAIDRSGLVGQDGPTHHGAFDLSYLRNIPNLIIMAPKDENELRHMLYSAYMYNCPAAVRYPRGKAQGVTIEKDFREIPVGTWEVLKEGDDIAIIACGSTVYPAIAAADELERIGIKAGVVNGRFIKPVDHKILLETASHTRRIMTVEENAVNGGFGSAIMETLSREEICIPVKSLGLPDRFITHGSQARLRNDVGIDTAGIVRAVKEWSKRE